MIRKSTWIVLAVFVLALAGAYWWQQNQEQKESQATPEPEPNVFLFDFGDAELSTVRLERVGDKAVELQRDAEVSWTALSPEQSGPLDSQSLESTLSQLAALSTLSQLDTPPGLAAIGLELPVYRIQVTLSDGRTLTAAVGKKTPTGSGYYVQADDKTVYVVNQFSLDSVLELIDNLPILEPTATSESPTPTAGAETPPADATPVGTP